MEYGETGLYYRNFANGGQFGEGYGGGSSIVSGGGGENDMGGGQMPLPAPPYIQPCAHTHEISRHMVYYTLIASTEKYTLSLHSTNCDSMGNFTIHHF